MYLCIKGILDGLDGGGVAIFGLHHDYRMCTWLDHREDEDRQQYEVDNDPLLGQDTDEDRRQAGCWCVDSARWFLYCLQLDFITDLYCLVLRDFLTFWFEVTDQLNSPMRTFHNVPSYLPVFALFM